MVVLNIYGKLSPICISEKLKIFISNLPKEKEDNWNQELIEDMQQEIKERAISSQRYGPDLAPYNLRKICLETFNQKRIAKSLSEREYLQVIADNLVCIYFDYSYEDMPFFDWTTNCFDGRFCEEDYAEKLIKFLHLIAWKAEKLNLGEYSSFPSYIYTTNHDRQYSFLLGALSAKNHCSPTVYINSLQHWGRLIDDFLITPNDYLQFDYLINSIYKDNEYNAYHLFKVFSLCEMLLINNTGSRNTGSRKTIDLDEKLPLFMSNNYSREDAYHFGKMVRQIRNKIGHGDFMQLNDLLEKYAQKFMDDHYNYDYSEYSRLNWIYLHLCCELDDTLARILHLLLTNRQELEKIKQA